MMKVNSTSCREKHPDAAQRKSNDRPTISFSAFPRIKQKHHNKPNALSSSSKPSNQALKKFKAEKKLQRKSSALKKRVESSKRKTKKLEKMRQKLRKEEEFLRQEAEETHLLNMQFANAVRQKQSELEEIIAIGKLRALAFANNKHRIVPSTKLFYSIINRQDLSLFQWLSQLVMAMPLGIFLARGTSSSKITQLFISILIQDILSPDQVVCLLNMCDENGNTLGMHLTNRGTIEDVLQFIEVLRTKLTPEQIFQVLSSKNNTGKTLGMLLTEVNSAAVQSKLADLLDGLPPNLLISLFKQKYVNKSGSYEASILDLIASRHENNPNDNKNRPWASSRRLRYLDLLSKLPPDQMLEFLDAEGYAMDFVWCDNDNLHLKLLGILQEKINSGQITPEQATRVLKREHFIGSGQIERLLRAERNGKVCTALDKLLNTEK